MSETYPDKKPPMPSVLRGVATVKGNAAEKLTYSVNFDTGECDCTHGQGWRWDNRRWQAGNLCNHKLKAIASLLESGTLSDADYAELWTYYERSVGKRFNAFVAVSAMHKELRRGDTEAALYWATVMVAHRGEVGVINYLRNIIFEETRDLGLAVYIVKLSSQGRSVNRLDMCRAIARFCAAPKKWELPWRLDLFLDEQRAYKTLSAKYGQEVAKPKDIIPADQFDELLAAMLEGFATKKRERVQYGLKGLFKSQSADHDDLRIHMLNHLIDVMNGDHPNKFKHDSEYAHALHKLIMRRVTNHGAPAYHELNALCDALTGETGADPICTLPPAKHKLIVASPVVYKLPLGSFRRVPLYANDNHTWPGKALMRTWRDTELQPGVVQEHIDFRLCGAYMGVAWRYLAFKQRATIDCNWEAASWRSPSWLWTHVDNMFY